MPEQTDWSVRDIEVLQRKLSEAETRAKYAETKLGKAAAIMGVCDGGQYINDWKTKADKLARLEQFEALTPLGEDRRADDPVCVWIRFNRAAWDGLRGR